MNKSRAVSVASKLFFSSVAFLALVIPLVLLGIFGIVGSSILGGCSQDTIYLKADFDTYRYVSPITRRAIEQDPTLDEGAKRRATNQLDLWRARLERHYQDPEPGLVPITGPPAEQP